VQVVPREVTRSGRGVQLNALTDHLLAAEVQKYLPSSESLWVSPRDTFQCKWAGKIRLFVFPIVKSKAPAHVNNRSKGERPRVPTVSDKYR